MRLSVSLARLIEKRSDEQDVFSLMNEIRTLLNREGLFYATLTTTEDAATEIWSDTIAPDTTVKLRADIVARAPGINAGYVLDAVVTHNGSVVGLVGQQATYEQEDDPLFDAEFDASSGSARLIVTGLVSTTVQWHAAIRTLVTPWP